MSIPHVRRTDSNDPDFVFLCERLSEFLAVLNGDQDAFYSQQNRVDSLPTVVVASVDGRPVGIGAFRNHGEGEVEIKRMFVDPVARGQGVGAGILASLEAWAQQLGYSRAVLETSKRLVPAIRVYSRSGYVVIPNYDPYVAVEDSVCMAKSLSAD